MKIISLNLRGFFDWEAREPLILEYLRREQPEVLLLQEVVFLPDQSPFAQVDLLNQAAGFPHRHSSISRLQGSKQFGPYREGLAVLSQLPVTGSETVILLHEQDDPHNRLVQFFEIEDAAGSAWKFANVHLSVRDDYALIHLEEVLGILKARGEKRIIGGDFNMNHLERHANLWKGEYVLTTEIEHYVSFAGSHQANDYFLVPTEYALGRIELSEDGLSDHRALAVEVTPVAPE
ncbi:MAG TPA: endonuclease/exonuclease/phosphatase family protein [Galbitalea sp.]|jgi:endonuclease/exonuclease/phosphatase family metal-dependent hydrolase